MMCPGVLCQFPLSVCSIDHWLKAGILLADTAVILCTNTSGHQNGDEQEHMVDAAHIMAVQKLSTLFPHVSIVTDIHYRYNIRFMQYAERNVFKANSTKMFRAFVSGLRRERAREYRL